MTITDLIISGCVLVAIVLLGVSVKTPWIARLRWWLAGIIALAAAYLTGRIQPEDAHEKPKNDPDKTPVDPPDARARRVDVERARDLEPDRGDSSDSLSDWEDLSR